MRMHYHMRLLFPNCFQIPKYVLGMVCYYLKNYNAAIQHCRQALILYDPNSRLYELNDFYIADEGMINIVMARSYYKPKEYKNASMCYEQFMNRWINNWEERLYDYSDTDIIYYVNSFTAVR